MASDTAKKAAREAAEEAVSEQLAQERVYKPDETIPGGLYYGADGVTLENCFGQRIDSTGKVLDETHALR